MPEDFPYRIIPYSSTKKGANFSLSCSTGKLTPLATPYYLSSISVLLTLSLQRYKPSSRGSGNPAVVPTKRNLSLKTITSSSKPRSNLTLSLCSTENLNQASKGKLDFILPLWIVCIISSTYPHQTAVSYGKKLKSLDEKSIVHSPNFSASREGKYSLRQTE